MGARAVSEDSGWPPVETEVRAGDLVLCASGAGQGVLSRLIRWRTGSGFSHAQLVVQGGRVLVTSSGRVVPTFRVLEVGWRVREAAALEVLDGREFVVWRTTLHPGLAALAAENARVYLAELHRQGRDRYPWPKLFALALGRCFAQRFLLGGPLQVCSAMSVFPLIAQGAEFYVWNGDEREKLDTDAEVRAVTPADLALNGVEGQMQRVFATPGAPVGV